MLEIRTDGQRKKHNRQSRESRDAVGRKEATDRRDVDIVCVCANQAGSYVRTSYTEQPHTHVRRMDRQRVRGHIEAPAGWVALRPNRGRRIEILILEIPGSRFRTK